MALESVVDLDGLENEGGNGVEQLFGEKRAIDQVQSTNESEIAREHENISESQSKKSKKQTSDVWIYFDYLGIGDDGKPHAQCKGCMEAYVGGGSKYGTSTLTRHMGKCKGLKALKQPNIPHVFIDQQGKLRNKKIDQKIFREGVAMSIVKHDLPFAYVEYDEVRNVWKYLNPEVKFISRITAASDVWKLYNECKRKLKQNLTQIRGRICLTCDLWTACSNEGYLCLTAHYVDLDWKLSAKILAFCDMPPPHSGFQIAKKVMEIINDWGINKKIFSITLDNASSNDNMQANVKVQLSLQNGLLCDGEFFHVRCCAHILNLIVQDGLKVISIANEKIRESIKYVKGSEARMKSFDECVQRCDIGTCAYLILDMPTRWNSTYLMLRSALKYKRAFAMFALNDSNYKYCPSHEEWMRGEKICEFLMPFYEMTNLISGSSYPTANLYFSQVWQIELLLLEYVNGQDEVLSLMASHMKNKFDKYWSEYSVLLAMVVVLDPRVKFTMLKSCYYSIDSHSAQEKLNLVKNKLVMLYEEYAKSELITPPRHQEQRSEASSSLLSPGSFSSRWMNLAESLEDVDSSSKSQLEAYLDMPKIDFTNNNDLDILKWWRDHSNRFPILANMACDLLSIPITTVASESAFSIGGRVLNKYRSRLLHKNVQALICTRSWLHGFSLNGLEDDVNDDGQNESKECSNNVNIEGDEEFEENI